VLCWLTPAGLELVERLDDPVDSADAEAVAMLSPEEQDRLLRMLDAIRAGRK
jgi:DNA-binding MarR family transcriptional regulator